MRVDYNDLLRLCRAVIIQSEGFSETVYKCIAGVKTFGYGFALGRKRITDSTKEFTVSYDGVKHYFTYPVTREQCDKLLDTQLTYIINKFPDSLRLYGKPGQIAAMCSFVYNFGYKAAKTSKLWRMLEQGNYDRVMQELLRWVMYNPGNTSQKRYCRGNLAATQRLKELDDPYRFSKGLFLRRSREIALFDEKTNDVDIIISKHCE